MLNPNKALQSLAVGQEDEKLLETFYVIMKEFGYTLDELKNLPIPTFFTLVRLINKEAELSKKQAGKIKKR